MGYPKLIDNRRASLADTIKKIAPNYKKLSIATGYWDLEGTAEILNEIKGYDKIRLIIGNEPISRKLASKNLFDDTNFMFPDDDFKNDLIEEAKEISEESERKKFNSVITTLIELINNGKLEVKVFRKGTLHAKAYIFGDYSDESIGIVGSSNFTKAGLTSNTELNALQNDYMIVNYRPQTDSQENGYLSWFDEIWNDPSAIQWTGDFKKIIEDSPLGNLTFGNYDSYIRTLIEVYPDELIPPTKLEKETSDVLFSFQNRNAGILINKLAKTGVAILADSVGLGKTITAGAVIKHYLDKFGGKANILIIAPAALKQQWKDDLASVLGVDYMDGAYNIVSEQDTNALQNIIDEYKKSWRTTKNIDLFVIDEAHNLRNKSGTRHDVILSLLKQHEKSHILLLTATPINNSLMDIANQIQLASKGKLTSTNVAYINPSNGKRTLIDFFDALQKIQSQIKKAEKNGESIEKVLNETKPTIHEGLKHYLVRSTRQGVEAEGGIIDKFGNQKSFPTSIVDSIEYKYSDNINDYIYNEIEKNINSCFEGIDPRTINLNLMSEFTQITSHPINLLNKFGNNQENLKTVLKLEENIYDERGELFVSKIKSVVPNLLQIVFLLGFTPYRPDIYNYKYYEKTIDEINALSEVPNEVKNQMAVHNILQITWLKRLESSPSALKKSIENYKNRIELFKKYLDKGYIVSLNDANLLESDYNDGEDIEQAFRDYSEYLKKKEELLNSNQSIENLKKEGIEKKEANPKIFNLDALRFDLSRDLKIINLLNLLLDNASLPENDVKMNELAKKICTVLKDGKYGKKVLVFSFFADTINSLKTNLYSIIKKDYPNFLNEAEFITGNNNNVEKIVRLFSPISKKHTLSNEEKELNFLFSTDVLSEGQNLQDAGFLVNYDLHWNPVRMIQRNGRINRLGSSFNSVLISNMKPTEELEMYLNLVHRLETKINTIKNTVGLDQGILSPLDVNPIEFIEKYYENGSLPEPDDELLAYTDEHIIELRKFLNKNQNNGELERIKKIPLGKWNYLPEGKLSKEKALSLVKINQTIVSSNHHFSDIFFIEAEYKNEEYIATHIEYTRALDLIKTTEEDNERQIDKILLDKTKIKKRVEGEARRQILNAKDNYKLKGQYEKILNNMLNTNYLQNEIDYKTILEKGIKSTDQKENLEQILRKINKEQKKNGSLTASTINEFIKFFNSIKNFKEEKKEINSIEGVLYYAGK